MTTGRVLESRTVAVVVCAYTAERWNDIRDGLRAVFAQRPAPALVVLVIDHNEPLAHRARAELTALLPALQIVSNTGARGLSGARNTGIAATASDIVAFLDDDAVPQPGWLAELTAPFADPDVWVTGGRALPNWPGQQRPGWWPEEFDWVVGCSYRGLPTRISQVRNVIGASMAMRRDAFLVAGTFREGIGRIGKKPLGGEETELCIRLSQARPGSRIVYAPASVVSHRVSGYRVRMGYFLARCFAEGVCKAQITATVGGTDATASERSYVARVLPRGVIRGLHETLRGRLSGFARAVAIIVGLLTTTTGYACGKAGAIIVRGTTGTERPTSPHLLATADRTSRPSTPPPSLNQAGLAGAWKEPS
jgi:GT2 family glycosyltransferase